MAAWSVNVNTNVTKNTHECTCWVVWQWYDIKTQISLTSRTRPVFPFHKNLCFPLLCLPVCLHLTFLMFVCICITCFHILSLSSIQNIALNPLDKIQTHSDMFVSVWVSREVRHMQISKAGFSVPAENSGCPACGEEGVLASPVVLRRLSSVYVAEKHQTPHRAAAQRKLFRGLH